MATHSHIYVTLFSNASRDIYEQNTHADFTVKLAQPVDLGSTSNWEVGLCEISCSSPPMEEETLALIYCNLIAAICGRQNRPQHEDILLPLIFVSTRVSKRVLCACRAAEFSGYSNRVPYDRGVSHPLRPQHDAHKSGAFS